MRKHQVDSEFVANNSHRGSTVREERSESLVDYSVFPSANSESSSFSLIRNGTNPFPFHQSSQPLTQIVKMMVVQNPTKHLQDSLIVSLFPPARSATESPENYEIKITNPFITITRSFSIPLIFPPSISETETNDSCSESNQSSRAQFFFSSLFPPARSETDSSSSKNYEIIIDQTLPTPNLRIFSFTELKVATKNFSPHTVLGEGGFGQVFKGWFKDKGQSMSGKTKNFRLDTVLGEGGFGQVFKGWLKDKGQSKSGNRMVIAVKKLNSKSLQGFQEWQSAVSFFVRLSHPNLIKLSGYCWEEGELLLVYEFMQKGSLADHLLRGSAIQPLPWDIRHKIAIGAARGLAFLHTCDEQIIYGDFKASNILLDESYTAKLLAKWGPSASQSLVTTLDMDSYYYYAPWYFAKGQLNDKSNDVYSFGVVLVQILTGLQALDTNRPSANYYPLHLIIPYLSEKGKLGQIMDSRLEGKYPPKAAFRISQLALNCLAAKPKLRPSMKEVLEELERFEAANKIRRRKPRNHASHPVVHRQGQQPFAPFSTSS